MEHATTRSILHYLYDFLSFWTDERDLKHHSLARIAVPAIIFRCRHVVGRLQRKHAPVAEIAL
jgi:hypothetical protein